jgi:hypothetical protein
MYTTIFYFHKLLFFRTNCSSGPVDAAVINHPAAAALRPTPANPLQAALSLCATELPSAANPALLLLRRVVVGVVVAAAAATARLTSGLLPACYVPKRCASLLCS